LNHGKNQQSHLMLQRNATMVETMRAEPPTPPARHWQSPYSVKQWWLVQRAYGLSPREIQVLVLLSRGWTCREIAETMDLALGTVKDSHLQNLRHKMKAHSVRETLYKANNIIQEKTCQP